MTLGFDKQLYVLPFDHRGSFQTKMFGWEDALSPAQTAEICKAKWVIYDGFRAAVADCPISALRFAGLACRISFIKALPRGIESAWISQSRYQ